MAIYETIEGNSVPHCHVKSGFPCAASGTPLPKGRERRIGPHPKYVEVRAPVGYNCTATLARGHLVGDPDMLIDEDFSKRWLTQAMFGLSDDTQQFTHSGLVKKVTGGKIKLLRSKMGKSSAVLHDPRDVDESYGQPTLLLRRLSSVS
jgi:hypothetical protein